MPCMNGISGAILSIGSDSLVPSGKKFFKFPPVIFTISRSVSDISKLVTGYGMLCAESYWRVLL
jgi:hypothetical protein